jgi:hypothetical protein
MSVNLKMTLKLSITIITDLQTCCDNNLEHEVVYIKLNPILIYKLFKIYPYG